MTESVLVAHGVGVRDTADVTEEALLRLRTRERRRRRLDIALGVATPLLLLVLWQVAANVHWLDPRIFTPPTDIVRSAGQLLSAGTLQTDIAVTVAQLLLGFVIGALAGIVIGLTLGLNRSLRSAFSPLFTGLYAVPSIAILPLLLVIFGVGNTAKILTVVAITFFVLEISVMQAVRDFDPTLVEAGRAYGARGLKLFRHVLLPGTLQAIFTGLRVSIALALVVITAVEFVAANNGLGFLVWNSWQLFEPADMYVGLVTIALVGMVLTAAITLIARWTLPWAYRSKP